MANETQVSCGIAFNDVIGYITIKKVSENAIILCEKKNVIHCHDAVLCIFCVAILQFIYVISFSS